MARDSKENVVIIAIVIIPAENVGGHMYWCSLFNLAGSILASRPVVSLHKVVHSLIGNSIHLPLPRTASTMSLT